MELKIGVGVITVGKRPIQDYILSENSVFEVYMDTDRKGASHGRNTLMKYFYDIGCDYWFIFDDDTYPVYPGWDTYFAELAHAEGWDFFGMPEYFKDWPVESPTHEVSCFNQCLVQFAMYSRKLVETAGYYRKFQNKYGYEDTEYVYRIYKLQEKGILNNGVYGYPCPIKVMAYIHPDDVFGNNPSPFINVSAEDKQVGIGENLKEYLTSLEDLENGKLFWSYEEAQGDE